MELIDLDINYLELINYQDIDCLELINYQELTLDIDYFMVDILIIINYSMDITNYLVIIQDIIVIVNIIIRMEEDINQHFNSQEAMVLILLILEEVIIVDMEDFVIIINYKVNSLFNYIIEFEHMDYKLNFKEFHYFKEDIIGLVIINKDFSYYFMGS